MAIRLYLQIVEIIGMLKNYETNLVVWMVGGYSLLIHRLWDSNDPRRFFKPCAHKCPPLLFSCFVQKMVAYKPLPPLIILASKIYRSFSTRVDFSVQRALVVVPYNNNVHTSYNNARCFYEWAPNFNFTSEYKYLSCLYN